MLYKEFLNVRLKFISLIAYNGEIQRTFTLIFVNIIRLLIANY